MSIDFAKGIATQVVNTGLRKVAGNLPGLLGINKGKIKRDGSDTAPLNEKSQNSPNLFQFPLDVSGDPGIGNHGHYIIFFINEQRKAKLSFDDSVRDGSGQDRDGTVMRRISIRVASIETSKDCDKIWKLHHRKILTTPGMTWAILIPAITTTANHRRPDTAQ